MRNTGQKTETEETPAPPGSSNNRQESRKRKPQFGKMWSNESNSLNRVPEVTTTVDSDYAPNKKFMYSSNPGSQTQKNYFQSASKKSSLAPAFDGGNHDPKINIEEDLRRTYL